MLDYRDIQAKIKLKKARISALEKDLAALETLLPRALVVRWGLFVARHEPTIHYSQARPTPQYKPGTSTMTLDCSGLAETLARWSGLPDPSGLGWGNGNTDSMLRVLKPIKRRDVQPGDYTLWHNGTDGLHVAIVIDVRKDGDIQIVSHGQEAGPALYLLSSYRHEGTLTFLSAT